MNVSDFKSSPFDIYNGGNNGNPNFAGTPTSIPNGYRGVGLNGIPDTSLDTLLNSKFSTASGQILTLVSNNSFFRRNPGHLLAAAQEDTNFYDEAIDVSVIPATEGTFQIAVINNGSEVLNENRFAGGYLVVSANTGHGFTYQISSHEPAAVGATSTFTLADPIQVTLDGTSTVSLVANPAKDVHYTQSSPSSVPVGVSIYVIPAAVAPTYDGTSGALVTPGIPQYAFVVSHGPVGALIDGSVTAVGSALGQSTSGNGLIGVATLTTAPQVAISMQTLTSGETGMVNMLL